MARPVGKSARGCSVCRARQRRRLAYTVRIHCTSKQQIACRQTSRLLFRPGHILNAAHNGSSWAVCARAYRCRCRSATTTAAAVVAAAHLRSGKQQLHSRDQLSPRACTCTLDARPPPPPRTYDFAAPSIQRASCLRSGKTLTDDAPPPATLPRPRPRQLSQPSSRPYTLKKGTWIGTPPILHIQLRPP